jgi:hypothetical protein
MNHFVNLTIFKQNNIIINSKKKDSNYEPKKLTPNNDEPKIPYELILNNLIIFLYKKLTPFLFHEVKTYLNSLYIKYRNKKNTNNEGCNKSPFNSDITNINLNNNKNNNNIDLLSKKSEKYPMNIKYKIELINKMTKVNQQIEKKIYMPKSEKKKIHSGNKKYKNLEKNKSKNKNRSKETKKNNSSKKYFCVDDYDLLLKKGFNKVTSFKTFSNHKIKKNKTNTKINYFQKKADREHSRNSSKNNSLSDSRSIFSVSNHKINNLKKNKNILSNNFQTTRYSNDDKKILNNKSKYNSSKKINNITKSQPLSNEKLLYQISFNNNYNYNINNYINDNNTNYINYIKNNGMNCNLKKNITKKNNLHVYQGNFQQIYFNKNNNKPSIMQNPLLNFIKPNKSTNISSNIMNENIINNQNNDYTNIMEKNCKNIINGSGNKNSNINLIKEEKTNLNENSNKNKLLNEEMMKKIKNTVDDNLKIMLNFSYENFLSKESEQESKEYSFHRDKYADKEDCSGERF